MKRRIVIVLLCLFIAALAGICFAAETKINPCLDKSDFCLDKLGIQDFTLQVNLDSNLGGATYNEKEGGVDSKWAGFYYGGDVNIANCDKKNIEGKLEFGMFGTSSGTETWNVNGAKYQTNDMYFWGMDFLAEAGWAFNFEDYNITLTPLGAYGYKFTRFSRTDFNVLNTITSTAVVDEDFNVHHLDIGGKIDYAPNKKLNLYAKSRFGFVVCNSADNSALGDISGDGGYIVDTEFGINYFFTENMGLNLTGFADLQRLKGGSSSNLIWPDNNLNVYGGTIGVKYTF